MKKLTALSLTALLLSTSAMAGGAHESYTTNNYNNNTTNTNYSSNMTILGNPTYLYLGGEFGMLEGNASGGYTGDENFWTLAPIAGLRIGENFGVETSYTWSSSENEGGNDVDITNYSIDALGYLPINDTKTLQLVGSVGVGRYTFDTSIPGTSSDTAVRYGAGLQYEMNPNWSSRVMYRRAEVNTAALDGADSITLGLTYNFR
jgi:opacity protein-like surface antigen